MVVRDYEFLSKAFEVCTAKRAEPGVIIPMAELATTMQTPIEDLELSVRPYNCLKRAGKRTLRDIADMTEDDLLRVRNLGRKSAEEVISLLKNYGVTLRRS